MEWVLFREVTEGVVRWRLRQVVVKVEVESRLQGEVEEGGGWGSTRVV